MKSTYLNLFALGFFLIILSSCKKEEGMDIYLAIGQSNMAGRATIPSDLSAPLDGVYLFTGEGWEPARNPLNIYSSIRKDSSMQRLSPAYGFARKIRSLSHRDIGLVVNAKGGSSIHEWMPGTPFFDEIVKRAKKAEESGTLKGVIWHQGESDVREADQYLELMKTLIVELRNALDQKDLPFVAGQVSEAKVERKDFNKMILELPNEVPFTGVVPSFGSTTFDSTHFDSPSQVLLGERYADQMRLLLQ
ncbi:MAG: sialate O-acetylesterase [Cyclobacteriaceae bacterium]